MPASPSPHAPYADPGGHDFRIGLAPIALESWFEPPLTDPAARKPRTEADNPAAAWGEVEGSAAGQSEALEMIQAWAGRHPDAAPGLSPLRAASRLVDDDLCLMEKRGGEWTLTAASLCAPSFFTAAEVVGLTLARLHGPVPRFGDRFLTRVTRIFDALPAHAVVQRRNWSVLNSDALFLPDPAPVRALLPTIAPEAAGQALFVRMERQTLRRLPRTGGLVFSIRIWRDSLDTLRAAPGRLEAFARAWDGVMSEAGADFRRYKRLELYDPLVRAFLKTAR